MFKMIIKTYGGRYWIHCGVFTVNFEHISQLVLVSILLTLNRYMVAGNLCHNTIYTGAEWYCRSTVSIVTFGLVTSSFSVSTVDFEHVFILGLMFLYLTHIYIKEDALSGLRQFLITESSFKKMKNAFNFTLKALLFSRYLSFCYDFLIMCKKTGSIRKMRLILKSITSKPV